MIKVGLTGGIGSGKSTVGRIFSVLGIPVFNSDTYAKDLYATDEEVIGKIRSWYGSEIFDNNNLLDRKALAAIIYKNSSELERVNALIHPKVRQGFEDWAEKQAKVPYVINESALLFEAGIADHFDVIINIAAPLELRVDRIMKRDGRTREEVLGIANKQFSEDQRIKAAHHTIDNGGSKALIPQVLEIHKAISGRYAGSLNS